MRKQMMLSQVPILSSVTRSLAKVRHYAQAQLAYVRDIRDVMIAHDAFLHQQWHRNPLNRFGGQCFSQSDEDGITIEILRRIDALQPGIFAEFGVGDGMENNTLLLKALGWRGFWIGGEPLAFEIRQPQDQFFFERVWVTRENVAELAERGKRRLKCGSIDVLSMDLDGNDYHLAEELLGRGTAPKLFIVEYNAKFPPPVRWTMDYDPVHTWRGDDYFGASLASFVELFERSGFRLVCCNAATGANAFFVRNEFESAFDDVPRDVRDLYVPPRYHLCSAHGHPRSVRTVAKLFA